MTAVSVGYTFSGCSGVETLSPLDQTIYPSPPYAAFGTSLSDGRAVSIQIYFLSDRIAQGGVIFYGSSSCGSTGSGGPFNAGRS